MKNHTSIVVILISFILWLIIPTIALGQSEEKLNKEKLESLDKKIEEASNDRTIGIYKVIGGAVVTGLSFVFIPKDAVRSYQIPPYYQESYNLEEAKGNATLFWGCLLVGSFFEIWGVIDWINAENTLSALREKKISISLGPILTPDTNGNITTGLSLRINF